MRILWKAINGREFIIEAKNMEEAKKEIEKLRKEHNIDNVSTMVAYGDVPKEQCDIDSEELPKEERELLHKAAATNLAKPDPVKLN